MTYKIFDTKIVWAKDFSSVMNGVQALKEEGWTPLGTPAPLTIDEVYGMMHMVYRDYSRE